MSLDGVVMRHFVELPQDCIISLEDLASGTFVETRQLMGE